MKCKKFCGPGISLRRALLLAAAQIILALIIANSSSQARTITNESDRDDQVVSSVRAD